MVGGVRDVITCAEFQIEIFMGYNFTWGRILDFPIDFSMGLTTVKRYCAACDFPRAGMGMGTKSGMGENGYTKVIRANLYFLAPRVVF